MTNLVINNDVSILQTDNQDLIKFLYENLRFKERNYFHNPRYRQRLWDGFTNFFNNKNGRFLTGLLPEILLSCKQFGESPAVVDKRSKFDLLIKEINDTFLHSSTPFGSNAFTLTDYQVDLVNAALKNKRGVIFAPTSSGKSLTMLSILKCLPAGTKTLVLQNRKTLAIQNYEEYTKWNLHNVGKIWGSVCEPNDITVATVQSIEKIEDILPKIQVLLVDEIHDMMSAVPKAVYRKLKNCSVRVAVSATPFKYGETDKIQKYFVKGFFGPPFKIKSTESGVVTTKELQDRGRLSKSKCIFCKITEPDLQDEIYMDAVAHGLVENDHFHNKVVDLCTNLKGRTLILVERLAHGDALLQRMPNALWVQGKDDDETRKQVIEKLQNEKECVAIATQGIFNTGINVFVHNLINAAGGQADHLIIQRMGRGLRTASDKDILNYYDFVFEINSYLHKHSLKRIKILQKQGHEIEITD